VSAQHQLAVCPSGVSAADTEKILNRLSRLGVWEKTLLNQSFMPANYTCPDEIDKAFLKSESIDFHSLWHARRR
jgi:hypothetical protein